MARRRMVRLGRRVLRSSFSLALILAGLTTGLLSLAGAALLEPPLAIVEDPWPGCAYLQAGSLNPGTTHIHLDNAGPETARLRFDWVDDYGGLELLAIDHSRSSDPWASSEILFRAPSVGAIFRISSSVTNLHASATIHRDDGGDLESRRAFLCLGS